MPTISCVNCGIALPVLEGQEHLSILCTNCNTRQSPLQPRPAAILRRPKPPEYLLSLLIGQLLILVGILAIVGAVIVLADLSTRGFAITLVFYGLMAIGLGTAIHMARESARNAWRGSHSDLTP